MRVEKFGRSKKNCFKKLEKKLIFFAIFNGTHVWRTASFIILMINVRFFTAWDFMDTIFYRTEKHHGTTIFQNIWQPYVFNWKQVFAKTVFPGFFGLDHHALLFLLEGRKTTHSEYFSAKQQHQRFFHFFLKNWPSLKFLVRSFSSNTFKM